MGGFISLTTRVTMATRNATELLILEYLAALPGCFAFKVNRSGIYNTRLKTYTHTYEKHCYSGTADIIGIYKGRGFAMLVKNERGKAGAYPTESEKIFLEKIKDGGGVGYITRSLAEAKISILKLGANT